MAAERTVVVRLIGMVGQYRAAMAESAAATRALDTQMLATNRAAANATRGLIASQQGALAGMSGTLRSMRGMMLGLGVPLALGAMAKSFFDFEQQMAHTKAVADSFGQSATGFRALSDAALSMGQRFGFSAVQVGQAQEALVKAGRSTAQVLGGELSAALTLAAAGTISLDEAARITAVTMTVFKKEGIDAATVADTLTGAANATVSGVSEMGNALSYVGPLAASLGVSFKDTVATISVFNQAGIEGERAGTNLRGMLTNLLSPSAMARKEMTRLGIDLFDATGKFVGMSAAAQILHDQVGSLGGREQAEAVGRLTTNASMPGFITLMHLGAAGVEEMKRAIAESATAEQVAAQKLDSVTGEFKKLGAAVEAASIKVGSTMAPALGDLAKGLTTVTHGFGDMSGASQLAMVALGAQLLLARRVNSSFQGMSGSIGTATRAYRDLALMQQRGGIAPRGFIGPLLPTAPGAEGPLLRAAAQARGLSGGIGQLRGEWQAATTAAARFGTVGSAAARGVRGSVSGLTSFLGGPFGLALAAATVGFMVWQAKVADNKRVADGFHAGLSQLATDYRINGMVSDANVKAMFRENEQMQWLITNARQLGLSMDTITKAAAGHGASVEDASRALRRYEVQVEAVRKSVQKQDDYSIWTGIASAQSGLSAENIAKLEAIGVKPKSADWAHTEIGNTLVRLEAVARNAKDARLEFEKTHRAEALLAKAMDELNTTRLASQFSELHTTADDASAGMTAMATNLAVMGAAESEFSDRINAMTSNVGMLASAFHSVADAQSAFFAASQEGLQGAFREDVEQLTGGGGTAQKFGTTTTSEESASQRVTAGKAAQDKVQVIKGGRAPKTPVPDKVSTTQNSDGTTTTVTTKTAADGTRTVTTHRTGIPAGREQERTRQQTTTTRRPDGTTIVSTITTDAAGNKTVESRTSHDPNDARKPAEAKKATPTRYVPPKLDAVTGQLDVSTTTGRKQHAAMTGMADATAKTVTDTFTQVALAGKNTGDAMEFAGLVATAAFAKQREAAIKALQAVGMNKDMAKQLVDAYYALPAEVATRVDAPGAEQTLKDLDKLHVQVVTLPQGKVALVANTKARAKELASLGGTIKKLPNGKFRVDFVNQTQAHAALDRVIAKTKPRTLSIKAQAHVDEAKAELATLLQQADNLRDGVDIWLATHKDHAAADLTAFAKAADAQDGRIIDYFLRFEAYSSTAATTNVHKAEEERKEREARSLTRDPESRMGRPQPSSTGDLPWGLYYLGMAPNRWGGLYAAQQGLLSGAQIGTSGPLYQWAEPATGGEAFIPRRGQRGRSMAILDKAASWYGASVQSGPAWKGANLSKAAPSHMQITVRGEGVLSGMIEATVDGRLVKVAQAVSNGRGR